MSEPPLFSLPNDAARLGALMVAVAAPFAAPRVLGHRSIRWVAPLGAALLSLGYIHLYLRGGPRIIDASAYWLQARTLAEGWLAFPLGEPEHAVLGRFLLRTTVGGEPAASVIFPPGYPAVLALGFLFGVPLVIGPLLAGALVMVTMDLARRAVRLGPLPWREHEPEIVGFAAIASASCAVLRYHTADTMAHGLAALCHAAALSAALAVVTSSGRAQLKAAALLGLAAGWLFATRPASLLGLAAALAVLAASTPEMLRRKTLLCAALASLPGMALWFAHQAVATGSLWSSAQHAYYAVSDGPPGCFRYGFGAGIGCLGEHGDFVRHNLSDGYGLVAALSTTGRRIKMHLGDALNFAPLVALVVMGGVLWRRAVAARALAVAVIAQVLAYAPFYFDGNYPGGGARMFADVLPHEQVLAALGLVALAPPARLPRLAGIVLAMSFLGFAFQSGGEHRALAEREGGRPMFEPSIVQEREALIFLDTDHGFNLAYEPGRRTVARFHGDGIDQLTWEAAGRPTAFRYHHSWVAGEEPHLEPLHFGPNTAKLRIEAESLWPPLVQIGGFSWPSHSPRTCVSAGRVLALYPTARESEVTLRLPEQLAGRRLEVVALLGIDRASQEETSMIIEIYSSGTRLGDWRIKGPPGCVTMPPFDLPESLEQPQLVLKARDPVAIDMLDLGEKR